MKQTGYYILKTNTNGLSLFLVICLLALSSCYKADPLPKKFASDYQFAIPIIDTTVELGDFVDFALIPGLLDDYEIAEGREINMGELSFPFYLGDFGESQDIKWLEPQIILDTKDLPDGTTANIKIYTKEDGGGKYYFWLPENYSITATNVLIKIPESPVSITNIAQFRSSKEVFLDVAIKYPTSVLASKVVKDKINIRFGMKFEIKANLEIKL
ncbi:MAG: hypothetical protein LBT50_07570 [Prevotellaceae bacterium]|nr:hypothetical protein [Prevotellaceae bacterium]